MQHSNTKPMYVRNRLGHVAGPWIQNRVSRMLEGFQVGCLVVEWPDGNISEHGAPCSDDCMDGFGTRDNPVVVKLRNYEPLFGLATKGSMGWAESYIDGNWNANSLKGIFLLFLHNEKSFPATIHGSVLSHLANKAVHRWNKNTLSGSKRNISKHYDLGNEFYKLWLDESMSYSSAWFDPSHQSLADAQQNKMRKIVDNVSAQPGDRVLEIGCGWGSMANTLATESGCDVTGISLSGEQLDYARRFKNRVGSGAGNTNFEFCDYRNVKDRYEHIVSVEMFEAVGREYWSDYFGKLQGSLRRGGSAVLQVITILEDRFDNYVQKPDFIQKYVFPGGMLPTKTALEELAENNGFRIKNAEFFGASYARTLQLWRERFEKSLGQTRAQGFDDGFIRMWRYYLAYCEAGFATGSTDVGMWHLERR